MHETTVPGRKFVRGRDRYTKPNWGPYARCEVLKSILKTRDLLSGLVFDKQAFSTGSEQFIALTQCRNLA